MKRYDVLVEADTDFSLWKSSWLYSWEKLRVNDIWMHVCMYGVFSWKICMNAWWRIWAKIFTRMYKKFYAKMIIFFSRDMWSVKDEYAQLFEKKNQKKMFWFKTNKIWWRCIDWAMRESGSDLDIKELDMIDERFSFSNLQEYYFFHFFFFWVFQPR